MSPLTKLFVVLLVVLSLLMTAATVTFVTKSDNYGKQVSDLKARLSASETKNSSLQTSVTSAQSNAADFFRLATSQIESAKQGTNKAQQDLADAQARNADMSGRLTLQSADLNRMTEALRSSEDTKSKLQEQVTSLRTQTDTLVKQNADQSLALSDMTNKFGVAERERRFLAEQLTESRASLDKTIAALRDMGGDPAAVIANAGTGRGAPKINGIVRETREFNGIQYATISVGTVDNVTRGMKFQVIDRASGDVLGTLEVESVEDRLSIGRLSGPRVGDIRPGVEVKTESALFSSR